VAVQNAAPFTVGQDSLTSRTAATPADDATGGSNSSSAAYTFEQRVVQEEGTH
jgi:hypothetical protein